jgi:hypothetical protein
MFGKRYTITLSRPLAYKFEGVAARRPGGKSALIEEALKAILEPQALPGVEEALIRRLDGLNRTVARIDRDMVIATETLALLVRYFLTITPPLPQSEQEPARLLGRERFEVFVTEVGRRMAGDRRLVAEVLESIARNEPDLFAAASAHLPSERPPERGEATAGTGDAIAAGDDHG